MSITLYVKEEKRKNMNFYELNVKCFKISLNENKRFSFGILLENFVKEVLCTNSLKSETK